jgi:uncharacterized membrane protein YphA (DoxX/SURF4 family)
MERPLTTRIWALLAPNTQTRMSHAGAAVIRVVAGCFLAGFHGWHKLLEGVAHTQTGAAWPLLFDVHELGFPYPLASAFAATFTQLIGGLAIAAGFLTRFVALSVAVSLTVAAYSNLQMGKDNQLALLYALIFLGLALYGGGWYSADAWLFGRRSA